MKKIVSIMLVLVMLASCLPLNIQAFNYKDIASDKEWELLELINKKRAVPVTMLPSLQDATYVRSFELISHMSHYRPSSEPWYTVLDEKGIVYAADSYELIACNYTTASDALNALLESEEGQKLLTEADHVGIGYASNRNAKNKTSWCIIGISCQGSQKPFLHYTDIHFTYGQSIGSLDLILEDRCMHGSSYLKAEPNMVKGYDKEKIGTQILTLEYKDQSAEFVITNDYTDVGRKSWYYDAVMNCTEAGYFAGLGNGVFAPNDQMTREMFVTVLGKLAGIDTKDYKGSGFTDVKASRWSAPFIKWAADKKIVSGYNDNTFAPTKGITRQEMCSVVKRFVESYGYNIPKINSEKAFTDLTSIAAWAKEAVMFCQTRGIINGDSVGAFNPLKVASRAEVAIIVTNLENSIG